MISELGQSLFVSLLTELFVLLIAVLVRNDKRKMIMVLLLGTVISGATGSGVQAFQTTIRPEMTSPFFAFLTRDQVEDLKNIQNVQKAITKAEELAGYRQNDYAEGTMIPDGVLIATNLFFSTGFEEFGVTPINNQGGWGLFLTNREVRAPKPGTYWCIHDNN